jgi:hypothetical protein
VQQYNERPHPSHTKGAQCGQKFEEILKIYQKVGGECHHIVCEVNQNNGPHMCRWRNSGSIGAYPGCISRNPNPKFFILDSRFRFKKIPDPGSGSASKNLSIFNLKTVSNSRKYDPGCSSRILILIFFPIPDPGVMKKKALGPGSRIRIRNTVWFLTEYFCPPFFSIFGGF